MEVWLALLIPIITTALLYLFWKHEVVIAEFIVPMVVSVILIGIGHYMLIRSQTDDVEFWGSLVVNSSYYEDWNEKVSCSHTKYCSRTDSEGRSTTYACGTQHMYDVDYHPEYWQIQTTSNETLRVSKSYHHRMIQKFGNRQFVDLHRYYHTDDGDKYVTTWPQNRETAQPVTTKHTYENRVQTSRSVFNYTEISPEDIQQYGLFPYPSSFSDRVLPGIMGASDTKASKQLDILNGYLGPKKQVRVWILVFENQPRMAGQLQEALWVGANKNEFVIAIGIDSQQKVDWAHVFSWTKSERLKIDARYLVEEQETLDLSALVIWLEPNLQSSFQRREFKEFDYIKVELPWKGVLLIFFLTLLANIITAVIVVKNNARDGRSRGYNRKPFKFKRW